MRPRHAPRDAPAPRNPTRLAPKTEHARNQVGTSSAAAAAPRGTEDVGRGSEGGGPQTARPTVDATRHPTQDRPALPRAGDHSSNAGAPVAALAACVRGAPPRHRPGIGRSLSGDPFLYPAGPRALHRRGRRAAPRPRRRARARDPIGAGREPRPRPQGEGGRRSVPRPTARDAATDANEHGVRAAELPEAPARSPVDRSAELRTAFFGLGASACVRRWRAGHGPPVHLDGARGVAARSWTVARGGTPGRPSATPPT
jgi:hypothetical protein